MPSVLGSEIDKLIRLRAKRMKKQKEVDTLKGEEAALTAALVELCGKNKISKASGRYGTFSTKIVVVPTVEDWPAFYKYIARTKSFELLQRRVGVEAFRERVAAGKLPAGTKADTKTQVTLTATPK